VLVANSALMGMFLNEAQAHPVGLVFDPGQGLVNVKFGEFGSDGECGFHTSRFIGTIGNSAQAKVVAIILAFPSEPEWHFRPQAYRP